MTVDRDYKKAIRNEVVRLSRVPESRVVVGGIPTVDAGMKMPFIVINFMAPAHQTSNRGLVSAKDDLYLVYFMVHLRTETAQDAEPITDAIQWGLTDFRPPDSGPITFAGGQGFDISNKSIKPVNFAAELYGSFKTNFSSRTY